MFSAFKVFLFLGFRKINFKLSQLVVVKLINIKHLKIYSWRINFVIFLLTKLAYNDLCEFGIEHRFFLILGLYYSSYQNRIMWLLLLQRYYFKPKMYNGLIKNTFFLLSQSEQSCFYLFKKTIFFFCFDIDFILN